MIPTLDQQSSNPRPEQRADEAVRAISSRELLNGRRRVVIEHGSQSYTLLLTRNDKLILVK